eukprot:GCRY01011536.1.p1 GENE.GCRY01011536.1~~GCRY01011536.1.p1  ORF type:complete len:135 (+),score=30.44 GCRY01011536.1:98-502(+)
MNHPPSSEEKPPLLSRPLSRYVDLQKCFRQLLPLMPEVDRAGGKIGFKLGRKIKKALSHVVQPGENLPDVLSYVTNSSKFQTAESYLENTQLLVVHWNMDEGAFDLSRRVTCSSVKLAKSPHPSCFAPSCMACF